MNSKKLLIIIFSLSALHVCGQAKLRKLPTNINRPSVNNFAPFISFEGNTLIYLADVAEDNLLTVVYTTREAGAWTDPIALPKSINTRLNFLRGYALSPDGKTLFISSSRSNGVGGFDLYTSKLSGSTWSEPANMALPVNSSGNEACPSITLDGTSMFFMRCDKMDANKADLCKIMMVKKKPNGQWDTPVELPAVINSGNSQTPRIMGDGETLVFSSNKIQPSKGGMDLYVTKFIDGQWSKPQALDFANTTADDQYVSASSLGRYLLKDAPGARFNEIVEMLFPVEVRPKATMKIEGIVASDDPSSVFVSVLNLKDQKQIFSTKPGKDGLFNAYVKEGGLYDLSVDPEKDNYTFFSKVFDLTGEKISQVEKVSLSLKPASKGDIIPLESISFKAATAELTPSSLQELRRLTRLIKGNADKSFIIEVTLAGYQKDSVKSNADLTEIKRDTLKFSVKYKIDSTQTGMRDSLVIKTTFNNDRTVQQAKAINDYLISQGVPANKLKYSGKANDEAIIEKRKTSVTVSIP